MKRWVCHSTRRQPLMQRDLHDEIMAHRICWTGVNDLLSLSPCLPRLETGQQRVLKSAQWPDWLPSSLPPAR